MCWSATTPKGRGKGAAEMGERAMEQLGRLSVDAPGPAPVQSDERKRVRVGIPVRRSTFSLGPATADRPPVIVPDVL
eukprot:12805714-Alexandrium_andersonii.AAC.1